MSAAVAGSTAPARLSDAEEQVWFGFLQAHTNLTRRMDEALQIRHRVSLAEHNVLHRLQVAGGRMRMSDLAGTVLLSPSGTSRLVDRLVGAALIARVRCEEDGRIVYATITDAGRTLLAESWPTYAVALRKAFLERYSAAELAAMAGLLGRLAPECAVVREAAAPER